MMQTGGVVDGFRLDAAFLEQYRDKPVQFGFGALGEITYLRTYSRLKDDGTNEVWWETVKRVVEGTYSMQKRWIRANHLPWSDRKAQRSAQEMYDCIFEMKFLPPGRGLWAMGSSLTEERELWAALNNCAFTSTEFIASETTEPFVFLMDASMLGIGVGFDTKGAGTLTIQAPRDSHVVVIDDSRDGWVNSLKVLLEAYFSGCAMPEFDYSKIRPAGAPIQGFGGKAAGPDPLMLLHEQVRNTLNPLIGSMITVTAIVDIMNFIGKCVVAGNVRRSAEIAFGAPNSVEFLDLKNYEVNPHRADYAWASNNSIFADVGMNYSAIADRIALNGEPGVAWLENMQNYSRMLEAPNGKDWRVAGGNPCLEQSLEHLELCCLCETFPARHESLEDYQRTLKFAYLYAKTVTLGRTPWPRTNEVLLRNRRIGLSQSGIVQAIQKLGIEEYRHWCEEGYDTIQHYDEIYSNWLAIPRSVKTTSVKPSGTVSLLAGATPGMHYPESQFYIRRIRLSALSELVEPLIAAGYRVEPCIGDISSVVVEIPVQVEGVTRTTRDVSMWEQLALAAFMQRHWADNQVSCTVTFKPETEGKDIAPALDLYQYQLKGISFLPQLAEGAYQQMPYEAITEERFNHIKGGLRPLSFTSIHQDSESERFCDGASCTIL